MIRQRKLASGTNSSVVVDRCQVCDSPNLETVMFIGYLPPVNSMPAIGTRPAEQPAYPAEVLRCGKCQLVQIGLIVDPAILFPPTYPYTSGTTRILRENFAELSAEVARLYPLKPTDLIVDIGSNDGTLLSNFTKSCRVYGIEPTNAGKLAIERGIAIQTSFFNRAAVKVALAAHGKARMVTATSVFAHLEDIHEIVDCILELLDTIYHEHLRYYSVTALKYLLEMHGLEIIHTRPIRTHGGSMRVYAARKGQHPVSESVAATLATESCELTDSKLKAFKQNVVNSKLALYALLRDIKRQGGRIYGVGAPSRASTLINYVGLDDGIMDCVLEIKGSYKIGKYVPGTMIPVVEEGRLFADQPEYAMVLSWHIADELMPKLAGGGFKGKFIIPLPEPRIAAA